MNAFEPVAWTVLRPSADSSATRLTAITDLPVPGPPWIRKAAGRLFCPAARTSSMIALKATCCSSSRTKVGSPRMTRATWSSRRLFGRNVACRHAVEDRAVIGAGDSFVQERRERVSLVAA